MKKKLDELLVDRGFIPTKDEARRYVMAGKVLIDDHVITKPGTLCATSSCIRIIEKKSQFVSRGGDKLTSFLEKTSLSIQNQCILDLGISTGGFSDVALQRDAYHVLGIDVGYGILDYKLRKNKKLSLLERTNAREVTTKEINNVLQPHHLSINDISLVLMDVSFISVFKILPNIISQLNKETDYIILIKPQFEAEKEMVGLGGIINNQDHLEMILDKVEEQFKTQNFRILKKEKSDLKGTKGNQEFFYHVKQIDRQEDGKYEPQH
jgi:23S rRNA (cytidine1920-2'-O)/16S rRNA (cytidine1409-2'-O)-methyltransferase